jgi:hypothetical protein
MIPTTNGEIASAVIEAGRGEEFIILLATVNDLSANFSAKLAEVFTPLIGFLDSEQKAEIAGMTLAFTMLHEMHEQQRLEILAEAVAQGVEPSDFLPDEDTDI